jgi:hypothetical protein
LPDPAIGRTVEERATTLVVRAVHPHRRSAKTPMQRRTHAALGAWTLGPTPPTQAWGDAFRSIELVGSSTVLDEPRGPVEDPIMAARAWLDDPARVEVLPNDVLVRAHASLDVAAVHLHELDMLAGDVARDANDGQVVDPLRLQQVDAMAEQLRVYAERLRELLDPETFRAEHAITHLQRGLDSAAVGGLPAFVAALA